MEANSLDMFGRDRGLFVTLGWTPIMLPNIIHKFMGVYLVLIICVYLFSKT